MNVHYIKLSYKIWWKLLMNLVHFLWSFERMTSELKYSLFSIISLFFFSLILVSLLSGISLKDVSFFDVDFSSEQFLLLLMNFNASSSFVHCDLLGGMLGIKILWSSWSRLDILKHTINTQYDNMWFFLLFFATFYEKLEY